MNAYKYLHIEKNNTFQKLINWYYNTFTNIKIKINNKKKVTPLK